MTTLEKLHAIEQAKTIYNIHYCNAGIGFEFYVNTGTETDPHWRHVPAQRYYPSFEAAVDEEYARLTPQDKRQTWMPY